MSESAEKHRKVYVDHPTGELKVCIIHGLGHSSDECKVLGDFGSKYVKGNTIKDRRNHPVPIKYLTERKRIMLF